MSDLTSDIAKVKDPSVELVHRFVTINLELCRGFIPD
jgi:hypothetical protein